MKSAKQRRQSRVIGPLLPWLSCVFHQAGGHACFFAFDICPFWCRKSSTVHTGAFCHSDLLVACVCLHCCRRGMCMWSGALIYLVLLGMVARGDTQEAGRAGARYCSVCFLPEWESLGNDDDQLFHAVERGMLHCFALACALCIIAASNGIQCSTWLHSCCILVPNPRWKNMVASGLGLVFRQTSSNDHSRVLYMSEGVK